MAQPSKDRKVSWLSTVSTDTELAEKHAPDAYFETGSLKE